MTFKTDEIKYSYWLSRTRYYQSKKFIKWQNLNTLQNQVNIWTPTEVKQLKSMGGKVPTRILALKLQRPVAGVEAKAQEIKMSLKPINKSPRSKLK